MNLAVNTNVIVRLLVRDDEKQYAAVKRLANRAGAAGEPILILLMVILETEWVLRSRYKLDKASIAQAFAQLLESQDVTVENAATLEEALYVWAQYPGAEVTDCLLSACAADLGRTSFMTVDLAASKPPGAALSA